MSTDPFDEILKQAEQLSETEQQRLIDELAQRAARRNGKRHNVMELKGLGKELWKTIGVDDYVAKERDSWDG